jgi:hypothetical protein
VLQGGCKIRVNKLIKLINNWFISIL